MSGAAARGPIWRRVALVAWLAAAVFTWNTVYGTYMHWGVLECIARQEQHLKGLGPRIDIDETMTAAKRRGVQVGTAATALVLLPGFFVLWRRRQA